MTNSQSECADSTTKCPSLPSASVHSENYRKVRVANVFQALSTSTVAYNDLKYLFSLVSYDQRTQESLAHYFLIYFINWQSFLHHCLKSKKLDEQIMLSINNMHTLLLLFPKASTIRDSEGMVAFQQYAAKCNSEIDMDLLQALMKPNLPDSTCAFVDTYGQTPLHHVVGTENCNVVALQQLIDFDSTLVK